METININNLDLLELKDLLKELKVYREMKKQLGGRSLKIYNKIKNGEKIIKVEYFPVISEDLAFEESKKIIKNIFNLDVEKTEIVFEKKEDIKGGLRVYVDDKVVDLSYLKIEKNFSK